VHVGVGEAALAAGGLEVGDLTEVLFDEVEVGLEAEVEDGVAGGAVEEVSFDNVGAGAEVF
jgi:hypothetical protein